ncbi:MAG: hypothetical protein H0T97_00350 [Actinobacteria bacterium]|nr:hypothetical protein [Actinomycetota bacterium]
MTTTNETRITVTLPASEVMEAAAFLDHLDSRLALLNGGQDTPAANEIREVGWRLFAEAFGEATFDDDLNPLGQTGELVRRSRELTAEWARELGASKF